MVGRGQASRPFIGWGASFFDYDNDCKLDLFVVHRITFQDDKYPRHLVPIINRPFWQKSPQSNRMGFGTKVEIQVGGVTQSHEMGGQTSCMSQNFLQPHFGLRKENEVNRMTASYTMRHSYRSWLDAVGTSIAVQQKLMRHASITTTMNIYGDVVTNERAKVHSKVVQLVLSKQLEGFKWVSSRASC
jgi:hypothetical protein